MDPRSALTTIKDVAQGLASLDEKRRLLEAYDEALALATRVRELDARVHDLEETLRFAGSLTFESNVYWAPDDPDPYCSGCFDGSKKAVRLTRNSNFPTTYACPVCERDYQTKPRRLVR